jgi:hypothetical protein
MKAILGIGPKTRKRSLEFYNLPRCAQCRQYNKKLAEAKQKIYDQGILIKKLQSDIAERIT